MRAIRADVRRQLEELRAAGKIGSSLAAEVDFHAEPERAAFLASFGEDLRFVLLTSAARVHAADAARVEVTPSTHEKCERCWHFRADVGSVPEHPTICGRCAGNLSGADEKRVHA
jgi:isoleucyl-tRNA synthetase